MSEEEFWDFGCMQNVFLKDFIWLSYEPLLYKVKAEDSAGVGGLSCYSLYKAYSLEAHNNIDKYTMYCV